MLFDINTSAWTDDGVPSAAPRIAFDIPAQPLGQALDAYGRATGMAALVDQSFTDRRQSAAVKGRLARDQALRILLAGTGLSVRYVGSHAFTLGPVGLTADSVVEMQRGAWPPAERTAYFSLLQNAVSRTLCRRAEAQPGYYRLALQLWIGSGGEIQASHFLASTGDQGRDAVISDLLRRPRPASSWCCRPS